MDVADGLYGVALEQFGISRLPRGSDAGRGGGGQLRRTGRLNRNCPICLGNFRSAPQ